MTTKLDEAINWIHGRLKFGSRPGLDRIKALLERVDHPEDKLKLIHIAGTNGKGSTVTFLRNILSAQGLSVGTFTSPYIEKFNERMSINGIGIPDDALIHYVEKYQPIVEEMDNIPEIHGITEFEIITAMGLEYFVDAKVDVAIIEVGLGGLMDSTNVITPMLTGITTIGLDHQDILGETIEEIAAQKAGIIKKDIPVVVGNVGPKALKVITEKAQSVNAKIYDYQKEYKIEYVSKSPVWGEVFDFKNTKSDFSQLEISMLGKHQTENAAMAIELAEVYAEINGFELTEEVIRNGLKDAFWPGRMEKISNKPLIILDGAHNEHAMKRLVENLNEELSDKKIEILFSALMTKDITKMLRLLKTVNNSKLFVTTFDYPKAMDLSNIERFEHQDLDVVSVWHFGLADIIGKMGPDDCLVITGSLYFVSQVREYLLKMERK
jgi:dihydrofolate synthase/folylpolyglutamate synthase